MVIAMERNLQPTKMKPLPTEDSEDEDEETSDEDETEDDEEGEELSAYESESDESTDASKKIPLAIVNGKPQKEAAIKAAVVPEGPAKRSRESNGKKEKDDEPTSKRKKPEVVTPAPKTATPRPAVPLNGEKTPRKESASKVEKSKPGSSAKVEKVKNVKEPIADKENKKSAKKKSQSPGVHIKAVAAKPSTSTKSEGDQGSAQKPKKPALLWTHDEETFLSKELQKDRVLGVYGSILPSSRSDVYWEKLLKRLPFMEKYEREHRIERLCEKVRRMRLRHENLEKRIKAKEPNIWKNKNEEGIFSIWDTIWGPNKATSNAVSDAEDDEEDEEESKKTSQSKAITAGGAAQKKQTISKMSDSESEEEDSDKEESPVKPIPLQEIIAATNTPVVKPGLKKGNAPSPMVDLNTPGKDTSQVIAVHDHGAQVGDPGTLAVAGQISREGNIQSATSSGELHAESLMFLQDVRSACLKMVDEARNQSLVISERILDEARVKTTQMVDEAREKTSQIMEELRVVTEGFGTLAGQGGKLVGSNFGSWSSWSEDSLFSAPSFLGGTGMAVGNHSGLLDQWREQTEAEQGLLLQRLQLVQEQSRIQQQGIQLKIQTQKQLAEKRASV